jgi:hypothetical protein
MTSLYGDKKDAGPLAPAAELTTGIADSMIMGH